MEKVSKLKLIIKKSEFKIRQIKFQKKESHKINVRF